MKQSRLPLRRPQKAPPATGDHDQRQRPRNVRRSADPGPKYRPPSPPQRRRGGVIEIPGPQISVRRGGIQDPHVRGRGRRRGQRRPPRGVRGGLKGWAGRRRQRDVSSSEGGAVGRDVGSGEGGGDGKGVGAAVIRNGSVSIATAGGTTTGSDDNEPSFLGPRWSLGSGGVIVRPRGTKDVHVRLTAPVHNPLTAPRRSTVPILPGESTPASGS